MSHDNKEPWIFGIDLDGKVWTVNNVGGRVSWTPLPNPGKVDFKRLSALHETVWGISCDHQIYVYLQKPDVPIRVREETYENQRWNPLGGFCDNLLPTDRYPFSNAEGTVNRAKELIKLPSDEAWVWKGGWQIENTFGSEVLEPEGWTYAVDFPANYSPEKDWKSCVRRRKWYRIREYIATNRWNPIPAADEDYTKDPFTDIGASSYGQSHQDVSCVWAVTVNGQVYHRKNVHRYNPEGSEWIHVPVAKGVQDAAQITIAANGTPFVVTWTGNILFRIGITPQNLAGTEWLSVNGPPGGIFQLSAGKDSLWAVSRDRKCWSLKGELQKIIAKKTLEPFEWMEIPGRMKAISVSKTDTVVLAISDQDNVVNTRFGITPDQLHGQGWKEAFTGVSWDAVSVSSESVSESSHCSDQVDAGSQLGSSDDCVSIRPDIPQGCALGDSGDHSGGPVNLCWIDGGVVSALKTTPDPDLEVGPWRDEILTGLQFRRCERNKFAYPNAVESSSSSWIKSMKARMFQHQKGSSWVRGELEINNGDTLVFYHKMQHVWMCAVPDILSVLLARDKADTIILRVRNPIDPGVADFLSFKFENEHNMEEWRLLLSELSAKPREEWTMGNVWITTNAGEVLEAGMVKMCDTPVGGGLVTEEENPHIKLHHPLPKGFLPGSEVIADIVIPPEGDKFALNLNSRDSSVFHFNPRLGDKVVVRNSRDSKGEWGEEERDGVFPFVPGQAYNIQISCTDTQLITTVTSKHKFMFYYKHRFLPKYITNFVVTGNVNVVGVRYNPARVDEVKHVEFITSAVPGHFWKVDSAAVGVTWAIGADMNVWVYTGGKSYRKSDNDKIVTDEQVYVIYENQRWNPLTGFGPHGLPTDRSPWSDETGRIPLEKDAIKLPSSKWGWVADWEIDYEVKGGVDKMGWQYAMDFPASYHSSKRFNDFVRRRRWKRIGQHSVSGPWVTVPNLKLVDLSVRMNDDCDYEVLGVCENGDAVARVGITKEDPAGTHWEPLTSQKPFISISSWYQQKIWAIGKDGFAYIRFDKHWQLLDRPGSAPLKHIRVGPTGVWAVGTNNVLYRRTDVQSSQFPEGKDWAKVCDGVLQLCMSTDETIWALLKAGEHFPCSIAKRKGISPNNPNGIGWEFVAEGPWRHFSITGAYGRNV